MNLKNIIEAANITGADSIHPGFGFLSENSQFAKICEESNIKFIGPSYKVIELMGNKSNAKDLMKKAGVPVIPGSDGSIQSLKGIIETANKIGYPILLKASAGGGGKGIRIVNSEEELESNYNIVKQEAKDDKLRYKMGEAAIKAVKASSYTSCGTVEFLVDSDKNFYFMEMNTRIQVEHPITEMRTGIDIVKEQIKIAAGEKLKIKQKNVQFKGHSIECRINAENPRKKFRPSPGKITGLNLPGGNGVRIDTAIYEGYTIPANYDSMIAKIITYGDTRNEAISKMKRALEETVIEGIDTNLDFLFQIIKNPNFLRGKFDTSFIEKEILEKEE